MRSPNKVICFRFRRLLIFLFISFISLVGDTRRYKSAYKNKWIIQPVAKNKNGFSIAEPIRIILASVVSSSGFSYFWVINEIIIQKPTDSPNVISGIPSGKINQFQKLSNTHPFNNVNGTNKIIRIKIYMISPFADL